MLVVVGSVSGSTHQVSSDLLNISQRLTLLVVDQFVVQLLQQCPGDVHAAVTRHQYMNQQKMIAACVTITFVKTRRCF